MPTAGGVRQNRYRPFAAPARFPGAVSRTPGPLSREAGGRRDLTAWPRHSSDRPSQAPSPSGMMRVLGLVDRAMAVMLPVSSSHPPSPVPDSAGVFRGAATACSGLPRAPLVPLGRPSMGRKLYVGNLAYGVTD